MAALRFFFYGTLLADAQTTMARALEDRVLEREPATAAGRLMAIPAGGGWYPALLPDGRRRVAGTLCTLRPSPALLDRLDRYEGPQYRRETIRLFGPGGQCPSASAYVWRAALPPGAQPILSGDFLGWLAHTGRRPFGHAAGPAG